MKKIYFWSMLILIMAALLPWTSSAQAPEKFTYQAVVRNASNQLVASATVGVRVSILQGGVNGTIVYMETQTAVTNANGLVTLQIGGGNVQQGIFADIDWANGLYFLKTETDPNGGSDYSVTSVQQLLSVPYALYSKEAGNGFSGDYNDLTNLPQIPQNVSELTNDAGYITMDSVPTVPTNVSAFANDAGYLTGYTETDPQFNAWDKDYNDLINTPSIPTVPTDVSVFNNDAGYITMESVPTNVSAFTNDAGYLTSFTEQQILSISNDTIFLTGGSFVKLPAGFDGDYNSMSNKPELFSGDYNDLTNKPTIPTIPTDISVFNNDAGYITMDSVPTIPTNISAFNNDAGYLTNYTETDPQFNAWNKDYNDLMNKPVNADFGHGIVRTNVNNPSGATDIAVTFTGYALVNGGVVSLGFTRNVPAGATLNINNKGAKMIRWKGTALTDGVIKAGDRCLFMYNSGNESYFLLANDRWGVDIDALAAVAKTGSYNDLSDKPEIPIMPTNVSAFTNDAGYLTGYTETDPQFNAWDKDYNDLTNKPNLATVATSGNYNDLINKPNIPSVPTNVSAFVNDAGYLPAIPDSIGGISIESDPVFSTWDKDYNDLINTPTIPTIPNNVSTFTNDAGYITMDYIPTNVSAFTNDAGYLTDYTETDPEFNAWDKDYNDLINRPNLATVATSGSYNDLINKPNIPSVPTNVSAFVNDAGYLTAIPDSIGGISIESDPVFSAWDKDYNDLINTPNIPTVPTNISVFTNDAGYLTNYTETDPEFNAWDKDYNDLTNKPTIPTVNNATLTIQRNGTNVGNFTANQNTNQTINITVPTATSQLTNDANYITSEQLTTLLTTLNGRIDSLQTVVASQNQEITSLTSTVDSLSSNAPACGDSSCCNALSSTIDTLKDVISHLNYIIDTMSFHCGKALVADHEGNVYHTVKIGNQCWTKENMRATTSPSTGTYLIPAANADRTYTGKQARWYNNDSATYAPQNYGLLYNWNAAMDTFNTVYGETSVDTNSNNAVFVSFTDHRRGICPAGWHLPNDAEWNTMEKIVSGSDWQTNYETTIGFRGSHAGKLAGGDSWSSSTTSGAPGNYNNADRNASGFSAVPGGFCGGLSFNHTNIFANFWSSAEYNSANVWYRYFGHNSTNVRRDTNYKYYGFSVRCVRNTVEGWNVSEIGGGGSDPVIPSAGLPVVTTATVSGVTSTSAVCGGTVTATGGSAVTARGVCYGISTNPTISGTHTNDGPGTGTFTSNLTGLTSGATYYVRAYATNASGTAYGEQYTFVAAELPVVTTGNISNLYVSTVNMAGNITSDGGYAVTSRGFCFSTSPNPTVSSTLKVTAGSGNGSFSPTMTGLEAGTTYYVRAFATNSQGTAYGVQKTLTTQAHGAPCTNGPATVTDVDGNTYHTLQMGTQCWMKENMRTTKLPNGTDIALGGTNNSTSTKYRYYPNNIANNVASYGYLYNWPAAMNGASASSSSPSGRQGICPTGWHIPSKTEWETLITYMQSQTIYYCNNNSNNIAKAMAINTGWISSSESCATGNNISQNNLSQFSAYPAGYFSPGANSNGYGSTTSSSFFWTTTQSSSTAYLFRIYHASPNPTISTSFQIGGVTLSGANNRAVSVRCLKD